MALNLTTWSAVVNKKWLTSSTFKELDAAVKAYLGNQTLPSNLTNLRAKWTAWSAKLQKDHKPI